MGYAERGEQNRQAVIAAVPEPVVACGMLQPAGTWGSFGVMELSPATGMFKQRKANERAGALNTRGAMFKGNRQTWFALTADKLYAIETKYGRGGVQVLGTLAVLHRADLAIHSSPVGWRPR